MFDVIEKEKGYLASQDKEGKKVKLNHILNILQIDGMQFADERTVQLIETFQVYGENPHLAFDYMTAIWFWSCAKFKRIYQVRF